MRAISHLTLDAKKIAFTACAMSSGSPRLALEGVRVESTQSGIIMVATDGNVMLVARSESQGIDAQDVLHVTKDFLSACRKPKAVTATVGFGTWRITDKNGEFVASGTCSREGVHWRYDHTEPDLLPYPHWRRTFKKGDVYNQPTYGLTASTLTQITQAAKIEHLAFSLYGYERKAKENRSFSAPTLIVFSVDDYSGMIMPIANHDAPKEALSPAWCLDA